MSEIDPQTAASTLSDIERVQRRTREELNYDAAASSFFVWGGLTAAGYLWSFVSNQAYDEPVWYSIMVLGLAASSIIDAVEVRRRRIDPLGRARADLTPVRFQIILVVFGFIWAVLLSKGQLEHRECAAYFPTLFMFGTVALGLWYGRMFIYAGVLVTALTLAAYLWAGPWFDLLMAGCCGGVLLALGAWFRLRGRAA